MVTSHDLLVLLRRGRQRHSSTRSLARSKRRVARDDSSRSRRPGSGSPCSTAGTITSHDDCCAASLADTIGEGSGESKAREEGGDDQGDEDRQASHDRW
jgi:hypothetical protein